MRWLVKRVDTNTLPLGFFVVFSIVSLGILDLISTHLLINTFGIYVEKAPVASWIIKNIGVKEFFLFKLLITISLPFIIIPVWKRFNWVRALFINILRLYYIVGLIHIVNFVEGF